MTLSSTERLLVVCRRAPAPLLAAGAPLFRIGRLSHDDARLMLAVLGVPEADHDGLVAWSDRVPLALTLGAQHMLSHRWWTPHRDDDPPDINERLLHRLLPAPRTRVTPALAGAAIALALDEPALGALVGDAAQEQFEQLRSCTIVDPGPSGLRMQYLPRRAILGLLSRTDPQLDRDVRRRLADHLVGAAVTRGVAVSADLSVLTRNQPMSKLYRWHEDFSVRPAFAHDGGIVRDVLCGAGQEAWWTSVAPYFEQAVEHVTITTSKDGRVLAYAIAVTPDSAPDVARADPMLASWLAHAAGDLGDRNAILWRDSCDLLSIDRSRSPSAAVASARVGAVLHSGLANPRYAYVPLMARCADGAALASALRARHLDELDAEVGGEAITCNLIDFGPAGLLGAQRDLVHHKNGLSSAPRHVQHHQARKELFEQAIRDYQKPMALARNPLGIGATANERVNSIRAEIDKAVCEAFGDSYSERALRDVLQCAYLRPTSGHDRSAYELNMSRTTYFRKLRLAVARVVDHLAA